jgi:hypothetical protein
MHGEKSLRLAWAFAGLFVHAGTARGEPTALVTDGESAYRIIVLKDAAEPERFAARELSRYLFEISGARLPIVEKSRDEAFAEERAVLVGDATPPSVRLEVGGKTEDAFVIRMVEHGNLVLAGASPRATLYAVYAFLEDLGVGFPRPQQSHPSLLGWLRLTRNLYMYDYHGQAQWLFPLVDTMRTDYLYYRKLGVEKVSSEVVTWPEFNVWAYGPLAWDPRIPLRRLVSDFCRIAYRPAAEPMSHFYLTLERWKWEWPRHRAELESLLTQAEAKAVGDATVMAKLQRLRKVLATEPTKTWNHARPPPPLKLDE